MELTQKGEMVSRLQAKASQIGKILNNLEKYNHLVAKEATTKTTYRKTPANNISIKPLSDRITNKINESSSSKHGCTDQPKTENINAGSENITEPNAPDNTVESKNPETTKNDVENKSGDCSNNQ